MGLWIQRAPVSGEKAFLAPDLPKVEKTPVKSHPQKLSNLLLLSRGSSASCTQAALNIVTKLKEPKNQLRPHGTT